MENNLKEYIRWLEKEQKSKLTIKSYVNDIELFLKFAKKNCNYNIELERYKEFLTNQDYKIKSVNRKITSIRQFLEFCGYDITVKLEKMQRQNYLEDVINNKEIKRIVEICKAHKDLRAKTLILTLFYTGMRINECLSLRISDINKDYIEVIGKGSKHRLVFVPEQLKQVWKEYKRVRIKKTNKLFTSQKGALTPCTANVILKKYGLLAGVDIKKCHNHNLRHAYGKGLVDKKVSLDVVADLLGHSQIETVKVYVQKSRKELLDIVNTLLDD